MTIIVAFFVGLIMGGAFVHTVLLGPELRGYKAAYRAAQQRAVIAEESEDYWMRKAVERVTQRGGQRSGS